MDENKGTNGQEEWDNEEDASGTSGGGQNTGKMDATGNKTNAGATTKQQDGKHFTQDQLDKMMTREKAQGRAAALRDLGIDPANAKAVEAVKSLLASQKTDAERLAESEAQRSQDTAAFERRALIAEAKAEAMMQGVKSQHVEDAVTLAMAKISDNTDFTTTIGELKIKYPMWFGEEDEEATDAKGKEKGNQQGQAQAHGAKSSTVGKADDKSTGKKGTGSSVRGKDEKGGTEEQTLGQRLAAQRKANGPKASYWGQVKES